MMIFLALKFKWKVFLRVYYAMKLDLILARKFKQNSNILKSDLVNFKFVWTNVTFDTKKL